MGFRKTQSVEKVAVVSAEEQAKIASGLRRVGKTSVANLSDTERKSVLDNSRSK